MGMSASTSEESKSSTYLLFGLLLGKWSQFDTKNTVVLQFKKDCEIHAAVCKRYGIEQHVSPLAVQLTTKEVNMDPSEARRESLQLHHQLRAAMRESLILATRVKHGNLTDGPQLRVKSCELAAAARRQIAMEDLDLSPVLKVLDSWGTVRCEQLERVHQEELQALQKAESKDSKAVNGDETKWLILAEATGELVRSLLKCLRWEEAHLLDPYTLRDDPVVADNVDG